MEKIRKGEKAADDKHRTAEQKKASKDFYKQVRARAAGHLNGCVARRTA